MMNINEKRADQVAVAILVTLILLGIFLLTLIFSSSTDKDRSTITVSGEGNVFVVPDTATFSYTLRGEASTAAEAQEQVARSAAMVSAMLSDEGVDDRDVRTVSFNVYPRYEFRQSSGERVLAGYEATQSNEVRVREVENAGELLSLVTENGASSVSGLQFTVWDETELKSEAREEAIADARAKAQQLARQLSVRLGDIVGFEEYQSGYYMPTVRMESAGGMMMDQMASADVALGENEIKTNVNITFEIK